MQLFFFTSSMFTSNDQGRKKFIESTRLEREKREKERIYKLNAEKQTNAAIQIQTWWKRRDQKIKARTHFWEWWDLQFAHISTTPPLFDFYTLLGLYCMQKESDATRLRKIVKCLTLNKFTAKTTIPYYTLLIDMRYMKQARRYLEIIILQCLKQCTDTTENMGPELTFLLYYLNPKTYKTKHVLDTSHVIDIPEKVLESIAQSILKSTACQFQFRHSFIQCIQQIVKLEARKKEPETTSKINALKLWLTTMTRLTLFPIEHADLSSDALDLETAARFVWTNTLAVPSVTTYLINEKILDHLRQWALGAVTPYLISNAQLSSTCLEELGGNGCLFLLANLVDLWRTEESLVEMVRFFLSHIRTFFSDKQTPPYTHYHPLFKWSRASWGNTIPSAVYDKVMKQLECLWSRSFMDRVFSDIIQFRFPDKKRNKNGELALFSMEVESLFSMYIELTQLFKPHRKVILYRIAFTTELVSQLWKLMNHFGPKGNMIIYLDAAKQADINKEPLMQVLKIFCEVCSIVFL